MSDDEIPYRQTNAYLRAAVAAAAQNARQSRGTRRNRMVMLDDEPWSIPAYVLSTIEAGLHGSHFPGSHFVFARVTVEAEGE